MQTSLRIIAAGGLVLALATTAGADHKLDLKRMTPVAADQTIPVEDFFRPPVFFGPKLNQTGTYFAAMVDLGDHAGLLSCELATAKIDVLAGSANKDLFSYAWLDQNHLITDWSEDRHYASGLSVVRAAKLSDNYAVEIDSATHLVGVPRSARMHPLVWIRQNAYDQGRDMGVLQIDATKRIGGNRDVMLGTHEYEEQLEETSKYGTRASVLGAYPIPGAGDIVVAYLPDKDGELGFSITVNAGIPKLYRYENQKWLLCPVDLDMVEIVGAGDVPGELIVVGLRQPGKPRPLQRLKTSTGEFGEVLLQDEAYDPINCTLYRQPGTGIVLGVQYPRAQYVSAWFAPKYREVQKLLEERFPAHVVQIIGSDEAENRFFVSAYSDQQPVTYYTLDLAAHSVGLVKTSMPWLDPARMLPMRIMKFKTRDGQKLEAFLTLPAGASKEHPAPVVVLPHGGPWVRDTWGFDPEAQFFASRGYAVLQPNYRGSLGYNWKFAVAEEWRFRRMHEDVTDAVCTLVSTGYADPKRLAMVGGSFGGYLAVSGAAFEPDMYRCVVTISGVFDWAEVIRESKSDEYTSARYGVLRRFLGDSATTNAELDEISPLHHADQIRVPVFISHGTGDRVANVQESRNLISALEKYHVPHETMIVGGEGHGMQFLKNQVELYTRIEEFLKKNLAPVAP